MSTKHVAPSLLHRPARGITAALVGLLVLVVGVLAVVMAVERLRTGAYPMGTGPDGWLGSITWGSLIGWCLAIGCAVFGVILLIAAWTPGRRSGLIIDHEGLPRVAADPHTDSGPHTSSGPHTNSGVAGGSRQIVIPTDDLERWLRRVAEGLDGVSRARVRAGRSRIIVTVQTSVADPQILSEPVHDHLRERVDGLRLLPNPRLKIRLS